MNITKSTKTAIGVTLFTLGGYFIGRKYNDTTAGMLIGSLAGKIAMDMVFEEPTIQSK